MLYISQFFFIKQLFLRRETMEDHSIMSFSDLQRTAPVCGPRKRMKGLHFFVTLVEIYIEFQWYLMRLGQMHLREKLVCQIQNALRVCCIYKWMKSLLSISTSRITTEPSSVTIPEHFQLFSYLQKLLQKSKLHGALAFLDYCRYFLHYCTNVTWKILYYTHIVPILPYILYCI